MTSPDITPMTTEERRNVLCESNDRLRAIFLQTFGPDEKIQGPDGESVTVGDLVDDERKFAAFVQASKQKT